MATHSVYLNQRFIYKRDSSGAYGTEYLYYDTSTGRFYATIGTSNPVSSFEVPTKTGYSFGGCYDNLGYDIQYVNSNGRIGVSSLSRSSSAAPRWTANSYVLSFDAGGGSVSPTSKTVTFDAAVGELPEPNRDGYSFAGWYTDESGGTKITASTIWKTASNSTVYAHWDEDPKLIFNASGGTVSPSYKSCKNGVAVGSLPEPTKDGVRFGGWYTESVGGNAVVSTTVYSWSGNKTVYAHWISPRTLTFNANGGTVSPESKPVFTGDEIGEMPTPVKDGAYFDGWHWSQTEDDPIDPSDVYSWDSDKTAYAHWTIVEQYVLSFNANGGTVSPSSKYVRPDEVIGEMPTPVLDGHTFLGWFTAESGGDQYVATDEFDLHEDLMLFAHWSRYLFTIRFNANGGEVSPGSKEVTLGEEIGELPTPVKYANEFLGWFTAATGGAEWDAETVFDESDDVTLFAHWETDPAYARTAILNPNGGTVDVSSVSCTYGLAIGSLPTPSNGALKFAGWYSTAEIGGVKYTSNSICDWSGSKTLYARWVETNVGVIDDWFALASANLIPIASDSGDNKKRVCVCNATGTGANLRAGRYSSGVDHTGGIWRNPTVTYRVVGDLRFQVNLGKAFAKQGTTVSGYMITEVEAKSILGEFPTITVSAVANEGADAINLFAVDFNIQGVAHAQNLMSAVSGGGELQVCTLRAKAEPVVCAENLMPCASDVVKGRIEVEAETIASEGESAPSAANGFTSVGEPRSTGDSVLPGYSIKVQKEIV